LKCQKLSSLAAKKIEAKKNSKDKLENTTTEITAIIIMEVKLMKRDIMVDVTINHPTTLQFLPDSN
jgi:hypothetical protein